MPHHKSCKKRMVTSARKRLLNRQNKSDTRSQLKNFRSLVQTDKAAPENLSEMYRVLDVQARKGIIPRERASRLKSRLAAMMSK